jgi:hypothetical protein
MLAIVKRNQAKAKSLQLRLLASCAMATSMISFGGAQAAASGTPPPSGANAAFQGTGTVVSGSATIVQTSTLDTITVASSNTVINFTPFDTANGGGPITFLPSGRTGLFQNAPNSGVTNFTVLNRIIPTDATRAIRFDGTVQSQVANATGGSSPGGTILFYSPGGIIASSSSVFDVGSLVLSAADVGFGEGGNTFSFSGATSGAAVDVNAGALITARGAGSYVALVAPRIIQSGTVKSDGSIGYIAAEAVDVTIQNNLFDISFVTGTESSTAINHNGSTELTRAPDDTTPQRIYVAAVPKNDAITTLVSGSLGYSAATEASIQNGTIVLSAGRNVSEADSGGAEFFDFVGSLAPANITIGADASTIFNASLFASASGDALITPAAGTIARFNGTVALFADRLAEVRAVANSNAIFDDNLSVTSNNLISSAASRVVALGEAGYGDTGYGSTAGVINVGGALLINGGPSLQSGEVQTSVAELIADLGHILVNGTTRVVASDNALNNGRANAFGGNALVRIGAIGSELTLNDVVVSAGAVSGIGIDENENLISGNATGGSARIELAGGNLSAGNIALDSDAMGRPGGIATGGSTAIAATGGVANIGTVSLSTKAAFRNADEPPPPTQATKAQDVSPNITDTQTLTAGEIRVDVINTTVNINGDLLLEATAIGNSGVGELDGGAININVYNGQLLVGDSISANAAAVETGFVLGIQPGAVGGGTIAALVAGGGRILSSSMNYTANAVSGGDAFAGLVSITTNSGGGIRSIGDIGLNASAMVRSGEASGNAIGGTVLVNINSGALQSGPVILDASATGGSNSAFSGVRGGDATGGIAQVNVSGGTSNVSVFSLTSNATAGSGSNGNSETQGGDGGNARSDTAEVNITGGTVNTAGFLVTSVASGGNAGSGEHGGIGGAAIGGIARIATNEAAALRINKLLVEPAPIPQRTVIDSSARGGAGGSGQRGGAGGIATGGTSTLSLTNAALENTSPPFAVDILVNSEANGGSGGSGNVGYGNGDSGFGGSATGGHAAVNLINNQLNFGNIALSTRGSGGSGGSISSSGYGSLSAGGAGGNASGGMATLIASAPVAHMVPTNIANLTIAAEAVGGSGGVGAIGGNGGNAINTGVASFSHTGGEITTPVAFLTANSFGGRGGNGFNSNAGNGGDSLGGTARITADGTTANLTVNNSGVVAVATSGAGGNSQSGQNNATGGNAGTATGGNAGTATGGTAQIFAKNGSTVNLTIAATANARSFGELGGSSNNGNGGAGGRAIGGAAQIDGNGGRLVALDLTSASGGFGGAGGSGNAGYGSLGNGGAGGLATGGTSVITNTDFINQNSRAFVGAFGVGGAGGSANIGNGGDGGAATGGTARLDGGGVTAANLTVTAGVIAGAGGNAGYGGIGGAGGAGTGGIVNVTNAQFNSQNSSAFIGSNAGGGNGGTGGIGGDGGAAIGGTTNFVSTNTTNLIGTLDVSASTAGGMGGAQIAGSAGGRGGNGGIGQGGNAQITIAGGAFDATNAIIRSTAGGGEGGFGETGGNGGLATGGMAMLSSASGAATQIRSLNLTVGAGGGSGGEASGLGGNGGNAQAGTAAVIVSGGAFQASDIMIRSAAAGGISDLNANGGSAVAGTARLTALNSATLSAGNASIISDATSNSFVTQVNTQPTANTATSATPAMSGHATGGISEFNILNGSALSGGTATLSANATIGSGRAGGDNMSPTAAVTNGEMPDGAATGGTVSININNATAALSQLFLSTNAQALLGVGQAGTIDIVATGGTLSTPLSVATANGSALISEAQSVGRGGMISIRAETAESGTAGTLNLGSASLQASGFLNEANSIGLTLNADAGRISISANGSPTTAVNFSTLSARALGRSAAGFNPNTGIFLNADQGSINSSGAINLLSDESISVSAIGTGNLSVGGDLNAEALNTITIAHSAQPGTVDTVRGFNVNFVSGAAFTAAAGSIVRANENLSILSRTSTVDAANLKASQSISVTAASNLTIGEATTTGGEGSGLIDLHAGFGNVGDEPFAYVPATATITGPISGTGDVRIISGGDVIIGGASSPASVSSNTLVFVSARETDVILRGASSLTAGTGGLKVFANRDIRDDLSGSGASTLTSAANIGLFAGHDIALANINVGGVLDTIDINGQTVETGKLSGSGLISFGNLTARGGDAAIESTDNVSVNLARLVGTNSLNLKSTGGNVLLGQTDNSLGGAQDIILQGINVIATGPITSNRDVTASASNDLTLNATAGRDISLTANNITFASLVSGRATTLMAANNVVGGASTGGSQLSVMANSIEVDSLTSTGNSVSASARLVDIGTTNAGLDIIINTKGLTNSSITLGTATAARDISLTAGAAGGLPNPAGMASIFASSLTAGDDIDVFAANNVNIASALTDGRFNSGYGDDPSNINVTTSFMGRVNLTTGRAKDNLTILTGIGGANSAASLTADRGDILVNGQMSANIAQATATLGSVTLNAAFVNAGNVVAGTDANVNFFVNGTLGTVAAARDITVTGSGQAMLTATSLVAGDDITVTTGGNVTITSARATGSLNARNGGDPSNLSMTSLMGAVSVATGQAKDNLTLTANNGVTSTTSLTADRGALLVSGGSSANINQATATLGATTINAGAVNGTSVSAGTDIGVNFGTNAILGSMTAGNDVNIIGTGNATIGNASAMRDLVTMVGANVALTSASAGRNLRNTSANLTATMLGAGTDVVVLTDAAANLGTTTAGARIVANAGTRIDFTQLMSATSTALVAGTAITGGNASAGSTLTLDANGGAVGFGMFSSGTNTAITTTGAISGNSANAGGALTLNSGANGITATTLISGNNNLTATASNGGSATITTARSGLDLSVNAANVSVAAGTAMRDVLYSASSSVNAGQTYAGRDILFNAGSAIVSGAATALNNITANSSGSAGLASTVASNIFVVATGNATLGIANAAAMIGVNANNINGTALTAGEDIRLIASSAANIGSATAGDDVDIGGATGLTLGTITTTGTARDDRSLVFNAPSFSIVSSSPNGSDISLMSNGAVSAASLNASEDISVNSSTFAGVISSARRMIDVMTSGNQSLGTANAVLGPINGTTATGMITFVDLSSGGAINLDAANGIGDGSANAAGSIQFMGRNGAVMFDTLTSGGSTNLSSSIGITGTAVNAGTTVQLNSNLINIGALSSSFDSIFVTGRDITVGTSNAGLDIIIDTLPLANSSIALGTAIARRDIILSGASSGLTATSLLAGDDIDIDIAGNAKINLARTTDSSNTGYGDHGDVGYGGDLSNITLNAAQAMIGTARARDNVTLTTITGTMAGTVIADRGAVLVNGGTSTNIMNTTATLGSVTINADTVTTDNVNAATDAGVNFGASAMLGTAVAGYAISVSGSGNAAFTSLTSGDATMIMAGGSVTGGTATAGRLLSVMADSIDVDSLTSNGSNVVASARNVDISSTTATIDVLIDTKGLTNSSITLGTVSAGRDISLTGGTNGITSTSLNAGDDIGVVGAGNVNITTAIATGSLNTGYGEVTDPSNLSITANSGMIMLGNGRAKDNVTLTTIGGATGASLIADQGAILVNGGASANIIQSTATLGSVTITAASVNAANINAATNANANFSASAALGAVSAGQAIAATGTGSLTYTNLTSGSSTTLATDGAVNGGAASAGSDFIANRTGSFAATGSTNAIGQVSIEGRSVATANVTSGTTTSLTASQGAIVTGNVTGGTGVVLRASDTVTSGTVTATANNVDVTATNGITLGSANAGTTINLTNSSGALTTGALIAGNDITVANGGAINLASTSTADDVRLTGGAGVMLGTVSTRGGVDQDGDGNDIVIRAVGPIAVMSAVTQPNALVTSDVNLTSTAGAINAGSVTARGAVTAAAATGLTAGSATSGTNIALTGEMINATTLTAATTITATSSGAMSIGDARAMGGNVSLTAAGALSAMNATATGDVRLASTNGGNITTGTLSSGSGDIVIASDGNATMTGNTSSGRNLNVTARNLLSVGGVANGLSIDLRSSDIAVNTTSGRIGEQDRTTVAQLTNTGSGVTTIGGAGVTTGYSLSNAEAQRIFAGDIIITAARTASPPAGAQTPSTLNAAAPDVVLDTLTLTGATGQTGATAGNIGATGRLRIETPGKLRTVGAVAISNLASANRFQVNAAQSIEVDAATGSVSLSGAGGALGGTIELTAPSVIAASLTAIGAVAAAVDGRAVNDRLAINDNAISDVGTFSANGIIVNVTNGFFVQNSGIKELSAFSFGDRRGVTVGSGGLTINAASPTTRIFVSGRQVQPNGTFITGVDFLRQQTINGTRIQLSTFPPTPFDTASTVNGCAIINSAACLITIDGGSIARDVIGQSDDETSRGGSSSDANFVQFQFKNLDEANFQPVIDDPVTGVGNDDLYALFDARDCTDDQNLEGCTKPK